MGWFVVCVSLLLGGIAAYRAHESLEQSHTLMMGRFATDMTTQYVEKNNGNWPRSWEELATIEPLIGDGTPIESFRQRLHFDFDADPAKLANQKANEFTAIRPIGSLPPDYRYYWKVEALLGALKKHHSPPRSEVNSASTNANDPQPHGTARVSDVLDFGRRRVRNFVFSNASRRLFVSHLDHHDDLLYQWDLDKKEVEHIYHIGGFICDSVVLSPNGRFAVVGCWHSEDFRSKTILLDTVTKTIVCDLAIDERIGSHARFDRGGDRFLIKWGPSPAHAFDTTGRRIEHFDAADFQRTEDTRIWRVQSLKWTGETHGLYCKDAYGVPKRLTARECNYAVDLDEKYLAATTRDGELIVWRLEDAAEVARLKMAQANGYLQYDAKEDRFLWGDATDDGTTKLKAIVLPP